MYPALTPDEVPTHHQSGAHLPVVTWPPLMLIFCMLARWSFKEEPMFVDRAPTRWLFGRSLRLRLPHIDLRLP